MNVLEKKNSEVAKNEVVQDLMKSLGLKLGEDALEMAEESSTKIRIILNDETVIVNENDEIFFNNKWVLVKDIMNKEEYIVKEVKKEASVPTEIIDDGSDEIEISHDEESIMSKANRKLF